MPSRRPTPRPPEPSIWTIPWAKPTAPWVISCGNTSTAPGRQGEFRRALKLNPNDPLAHALYSYCLMTLGRYQESTRSMQMALELDPLSRFINYVGWAPLAYARKYDEALRQLEQQYHESYPDPQFYRNTKFDILKSAGRYEEALDLVDELDPADK